jgi:integrase
MTGGFASTFLEAQRRAGVSVIRLHDTRATFATILWSQRRSLASIQSKLGHADPRTTIGYIKGYHGQDDESEIIGDGARGVLGRGSCGVKSAAR